MSIMSLATKLVGDVTSQITKQVGLIQGIQEQVGSASSALSSAWYGPDADAFVADLKGRLLPAIVNLISSIGGFSLNIGKAMEVVQNADKASSSIVSDVVQGFGDIYKG